MDHQVSCINKTNRNDPHERIHSIGGKYPDGRRWRVSQSDAIRFIEGRSHSFFTLVNGRRANVIVAAHNGHKYIKTENDGVHPNNLLALNECPI